MLLMAGGIDIGNLIANSCRFNDDDSAFSSRAYGAAAPDDDTLLTISMWVKRGNPGTAQSILGSGTTTVNLTHLFFQSDDTLIFSKVSSSAETARLITDMKFRDPSAWYHIVFQFDSDQAASADRATIWVNGVEVTYNISNAIDLGLVTHWMNNTWTTYVGKKSSSAANYFDGYLAEVIGLDGIAGTATDFGKFNAEGHWVPKDYSGSYGSNGFHLDFAVAPGTGNGAGTDVSGNANHFTDSGLAANDQRTDTPTSNHCTWSPLDTTGPVYTDGNLVATYNATELARTTWMLPSGKWYWEVNCTTAVAAADVYIGVANALASKTGALGADNYGWAINHPSGTTLDWDHAGASTSFTDTGTIVTGTYIMVAYDADTGKLWFGVDGSWLDSGDPAAGTGEVVTTDMLVGPAASGSTDEGLTLRTETGDFEGTAPTGFNALTVTNLSDVNDAPIPKGSDYFDVVTWAGDGSNPRSLTGLDFQPALVWVKNRTNTYNHYLADAVRGAGLIIFPDAASADSTPTVSQWMRARLTRVRLTSGRTITSPGAGRKRPPPASTSLRMSGTASGVMKSPTASARSRNSSCRKTETRGTRGCPTKRRP
jgi:hypothetical protein